MIRRVSPVGLAEMIEEEIEIELAVADVEVVLAPDEGEAATEFQQECLEVAEQTDFQFAFLAGDVLARSIEAIAFGLSAADNFDWDSETEQELRIARLTQPQQTNHENPIQFPT